MDWNGILSGLIGVVFGGGFAWLFTIRAMKRKANGEATQTEADGWKAMQDVYQQTIEDLKKYSNDIRDDRELIREENRKLRGLNSDLRDKYDQLENTVRELRNTIARHGRRLEAVLPFTCGVVGCTNRTKVEWKNDDNTNEENNE